MSKKENKAKQKVMDKTKSNKKSNNNLTEIVVILDRSGSMNGLERETIGGYNSFIEKQKKEDSEAILTTILFDNEYEILHDRVNLREIELITTEDYYTRGMTALLDAIGKSIQDTNIKISNLKEEDKPGKVIFVITTDGYENASKEFSHEKIKELVEKQKNEGWEFIFFGANIDTFETARGIGIDRSFDYKADEKGILNQMCQMSDIVIDYREDKKEE
jgi:uncharacterized protein YegL